MEIYRNVDNTVGFELSVEETQLAKKYFAKHYPKTLEKMRMRFNECGVVDVPSAIERVKRFLVRRPDPNIAAKAAGLVVPRRTGICGCAAANA